MGNVDVAVLVVEDEPLILMAAVAFLEDAGFVVYDARDAAAAVALLEKRDDIGVVFTDVDMPGAMNGLALAHTVRDRWPPVEVIVTSGHWQITGSDLPARGVFLPKPYRESDVVEQVRRMAA